MLSEIRQMCVEQRWQDVIAIAPSLLEEYTGDDKARLHLYIVGAYSMTAKSSSDWDKALHHAKAGFACSTPDGLVRTWALQKLSSVSVDMGLYADAEQYARQYLEVVDDFPALSAFTPYVIRDLSIVNYARGEYSISASRRRDAMRMFLATENHYQAERTAIGLAWALIKEGMVAEAEALINARQCSELASLWDGAISALCFAKCQYDEAVIAGKRSLRAKRHGFDFKDAADVCLIIAGALRKLRRLLVATYYAVKAIEYAARQAHAFATACILSPLKRGGGWAEEVAEWGGSWHPNCMFATGLG